MMAKIEKVIAEKRNEVSAKNKDKLLKESVRKAEQLKWKENL